MEMPPLLLEVIDDCGEYLEMNPGREWQFIALVLVRKMEKANAEIEYYRKVMYERNAKK